MNANAKQSLLRLGRRLAALAALALAPAWVAAQVYPTYDSGSTGADGSVDISLPEPRSETAMAFDAARGRTVLYGGYGNIPNDVWEWDGSSWTRKTFSGGPSARNSHAMAYNAQKQRITLFGGSDTNFNYNNETWEWDGTNWTKVSNAGPDPRIDCPMAYDSIRHRLVLFGGYFYDYHGTGQYTYFGDTWEWDGTNWAKVATTGPQSINTGSGGSMTFDPARGVCVLVYQVSGSAVQVWEWDGSTWYRAHTGKSGYGQSYYGVAYDAEIGKIVAPDLYNRVTWTWDGKTWELLATGENPLDPGFAGVLAYDSTRHRLVYFGGDSSATAPGSTWEFDGANWIERLPLDLPAHPDGIFNFVSFHLRSGALRFRPNAANTPVRILASGDITLDTGSSIDVGGQGATHVVGAYPETEARGGPGGFAGGLGGRRKDFSGSYAGGAGKGPGGGGPTADSSYATGNGGGFATPGQGPIGGQTYGNAFLQPLTGGSGGSGNPAYDSQEGGSGGGGGGAILLASSTKITLNGYLKAGGGEGGSYGGGGSGGAIRLVAPVVTSSGGGSLSVLGGGSSGRKGGDGRIRVEGYSINNIYAYPGAQTSIPYPAIRENIGKIRVVGVQGVGVPPQPRGDEAAPDVTLGPQGGPVTISLLATGVAPGTVIKVRIVSGTAVQVVDSTPVTTSGNATATATLPPGLAEIDAYASFMAP